MPLCCPKPAEGSFWSVVDDKKDDNFALEVQGGITSLFTGACCYRIILRQHMIEIARADSKDAALKDWEVVQKLYQDEMVLVGSTKFSDRHLLDLFEALWERDHPLETSKV